MSDNDILIKMSNQIGELNGRLAQSLDAQNKTNEALFKLIADHEQRIRALEDRVSFLTEELNACYEQAAQIEELNIKSKI